MLQWKTIGIIPFIAGSSNKIKRNKLNIVFDLDNTLFSSEMIRKFNQHNNTNISKCDYITKLPDKTDDEQYMVWKRPFVDFSLFVLSYFTNIYIYTAATEEYANDILKGCFPNFNPKFIYHRKHWIVSNKTKDLEIIKMDNTILIDDKLYNNVNKQKFYHIPPFYYYNKNKDYEMLKLLLRLRI
jgi:TFIIF-interacting CTD phosphatase-like protein